MEKGEQVMVGYSNAQSSEDMDIEEDSLWVELKGVIKSWIQYWMEK